MACAVIRVGDSKSPEWGKGQITALLTAVSILLRTNMPHLSLRCINPHYACSVNCYRQFRTRFNSRVHDHRFVVIYISFLVLRSINLYISMTSAVFLTRKHQFNKFATS